MGDVVRTKTDAEYDQCAKSQTNASQPPPPADIWETGQDKDQIDVAEAADDEGDAEEDEEELEAERQQDCKLFVGEIQVAARWRCGGSAAIGVSPLEVRHDVDDDEVQRRQQPEHDTGQQSITRPPMEGMPDGVGDPQVTLHTHGGEQQGAVVDGDIEEKPSEGTEGVGQQPLHVIKGLLHFKRQQSQENQVGDGQVEEEDVYRGWLAIHLAAEGTKCQDVGGNSHEEGDNVDRKQQIVCHGVFLGTHSHRHCREEESKL